MTSAEMKSFWACAIYRDIYVELWTSSVAVMLCYGSTKYLHYAEYHCEPYSCKRTHLCWSASVTLKFLWWRHEVGARNDCILNLIFVFVALQYSWQQLGSKILRLYNTYWKSTEGYAQSIKTYFLLHSYRFWLIFSTESVRGGKCCQCNCLLPYLQMSTLWLSFL